MKREQTSSGVFGVAALAVMAAALLSLRAGAQDTTTLRGTFKEYRPDERVLIFLSVQDGNTWRYRLPVARNAAVLINNQAASLADFDDGMEMNVRFRPVDGENTVFGVNARAEQRPVKAAAREDRPREVDIHTLAYPTGDRATSVLLIQASGPAKARVGQAYTYQITATNLTKHLVLEDVLVSHRLPKDVSVVGVERPGKAGHDGQGQGSGQKKARQGGDQNQRAGQDDGQARGKQGGKQEEASASNEKQDKSQGWEQRWLFQRLEPGESKTIRVRAVGHQVGSMSGCLAVTYTPLLCLRTEFTKPELELTKQAPKKVDICDPITFRYTVKNTGTAAAKDLRVREELPDGLTLAGEKGGKAGRTVSFDVGALEPGKSREFTAKVWAEEPGKYRGAATAVTANDLRVQSSETTTRVTQVDLRTEIEGAESEYVNQPTTFTVKVRNQGDARAENVRLNVDIGDGAHVVRAGRITAADAEDDAENPAAKGGQARQGAAARTNDGRLTWDLGALDSGAGKQVRVTLVGRDKGTVQIKAVATAECGRDIDGARDTAVTKVEMQTIPALRLSMVDETDPVKVGGTTRYTISVLNQGTGPDQNVKLVLKLPQELEFVDAQGPTKAQADGQSVQFGPVEKLAAGDRLDWRVQVRARQSGDVRSRIELSSDYLSSAVPSVEPTRLIK